MTAENFVYWLQGFLEIQKPETMSAEQIQEIKNHIQLVLTKVTPPNTLPLIWENRQVPMGTSIEEVQRWNWQNWPPTSC